MGVSFSSAACRNSRLSTVSSAPTSSHHVVYRIRCRAHACHAARSRQVPQPSRRPKTDPEWRSEDHAEDDVERLDRWRHHQEGLRLLRGDVQHLPTDQETLQLRWFWCRADAELPNSALPRFPCYVLHPEDCGALGLPGGLGTHAEADRWQAWQEGLQRAQRILPSPWQEHAQTDEEGPDQLHRHPRETVDPPV